MKFKDAITQLALEVGKKPEDTDIDAKLRAALNFAKIEVGKAANWKVLKRDAELTIVADYTTGTASITNGSRTVNGSGTAWTSAMVGRYFTPYGGNAYKIISVSSATQITLESEIIESSATLAYLIHKKYYRVNSDIRLVLPDESRDDLPVPFTIEGYDLGISIYSAGTVSTANGSSILAGTGTAFLGNVFPGDMITIEGVIYRVKTVNSDIEISMTNKATADLTDNAYSIESDTPYQADFTSIPGSRSANFDTVQNSLVRYNYLRNLYPMVNDNDTTELPISFDRCILDFSKSEFGRYQKAADWKDDLLVAQARLEKLKMDTSLIHFPYRTFPPKINNGTGRGNNRTILSA